MLIGSGIVGQGGCILLYRSADLLDWDYVGPFLIGDAASVDRPWTGTVWECPQLVEVDGATILIVSVNDAWRTLYSIYFVGERVGDTFVPRRSDRLDGGPDLYAPAVMTDAVGRRLLWGWSWEARAVSAQVGDGWAGVLTTPRQLRMVGDRLAMYPVPELTLSRTEETKLAGLPIPADQVVPLLGVSGRSIDVEATLGGGTSQRVGLRLLASPDGSEYVALTWDRYRGHLTLDRERASASPDAFGGVSLLTLAPSTPEPSSLSIRILIDGSLIEVFTADGSSMTMRAYPTRSDSLGVCAFAYGGPAEVVELSAWSMSSSITH